MKIETKLTLNNIRKNPKRTIFTSISIILCTFLIFTVMLIISSIRNGIDEALTSDGNDYYFAIKNLSIDDFNKIKDKEYIDTIYIQNETVNYSRKRSDKMGILKVENVTKIYGKGEAKVVALNNISLEVVKGEFIAIIGPSGSGKSTLLHTMAGLEPPTEGKVYFYEKNMYEMSKKELAILRREQIGIIYQFYNLLPTLNVEENITLPVELDKKKINKKKLDSIIRFLNLEERRKHLPNELSGGQQQKVAIGRALMIDPKVILADEPTRKFRQKIK